MIKKLTYRQKIRYSGVLAILLLVICYKFSFSKTIEQYKLYKLNQKSASISENEIHSLQLLKSKNNFLNDILNQFILDTVDQSKNILTIASQYCDENDLRLEEYKPYAAVQKDSLSILNRSITVQGKFIPCLKLVNFLETKTDVGRIGSVQFKSISNPAKNETYLNCTIFIQNLITNENVKK